MFFDDLESGGLKKLWGMDFLKYKLVRVGLQETNNLFLGLTNMANNLQSLLVIDGVTQFL